MSWSLPHMLPGRIGTEDACWRCDRFASGTILVNDPMMDRRSDAIGICPACAKVRMIVMRKYVEWGRGIPVVEVQGDEVTR